MTAFEVLPFFENEEYDQKLSFADRRSLLLKNINSAIDDLLSDKMDNVNKAKLEEKNRTLIVMNKLEADFSKLFTNPQSLSGAVRCLQELRRRLQ